MSEQTRPISEEKVTGLHVSGFYNSTLFTNCCGLAVGRYDPKCPGCGTRIVELRKVIS